MININEVLPRSLKLYDPTFGGSTERRNVMSNRRVISLAAVAALGVVCVSADALAARVAVRGGAVAYRGGALAYRGAVGYRGWGYRGDYYRPGLGLAAGAVAGGAITASRPSYDYGSYGNYGNNPDYSTSNNSTSYSTPTDYGAGYYGYLSIVSQRIRNMPFHE
jgi:hypothetical protein